MNTVYRILFIWHFLLLGPLSLVAAQVTPTCPDIVQAALQATSSACAGVARNQACYGNVNLQTQFRPNAGSVSFDKIGDLADVASIQSLQLSSMSLNDNSWGIALMKVQADLPDTLPGQNVTFVLFGNVQLDNGQTTSATQPMTAKGNANVRSHPSTQGTVLAGLKSGQSVTANGRLADSSWIRVELPDGSGNGWVSAALLQGGDAASLQVIDAAASAPTFGPMQAFDFRSGIGDTACSQVPPDGILLQSPTGQKATLMINGAQFMLGSTVYVQAQPGGFMAASVVEGSVTITANGVTVTVPAGNSTRVPLDANGQVNGAPEAPQPYDATTLAALPVTLLPIPVSIAGLAVTPIATAAATAEATSLVTSDLPPKAGTWSSTDTATGTGCGVNGTMSGTFIIKIENNGAVLDFGQLADRTAPGVYVQRISSDGTFTETGIIHVLSPTHMHYDHTFSLVAVACSMSDSEDWVYVGP